MIESVLEIISLMLFPSFLSFLSFLSYVVTFSCSLCCCRLSSCLAPAVAGRRFGLLDLLVGSLCCQGCIDV
jgi:hypothetical protein